MINTAELLDNLVAMLRDIPELVAEMNGDPERIFAYHDSYPKKASWVHALHSMPAPGIMAVWQGSGPGSFGGMDGWKNYVTLYLRARETFEGDPATTYNLLFRLIIKGIPTAAGVQMLNATVHASCYPMDLPPMERQTDAEGLDYFQVPLSFTEIGDD